MVTTNPRRNLNFGGAKEKREKKKKERKKRRTMALALVPPVYPAVIYPG